MPKTKPKTPCCTQPDRHNAALVCGYPLPCPHHPDPGVESVVDAVELAHLAGKCVRAIKEVFPPNIGLLVLTFNQDGKPGHMGYASTGRREDCIKAVREWLQNFEGN